MRDLDTGELTVEPIISYPREAESGKSYLLSIDLRPLITPEDKWPLESEECAIYCLLNTAPLFSNRPLGDTAVVIHRFGGSYGPARFLLTAADEEVAGMIRITLVNGWGVPLGELTRDIHITKRGVPALPGFILTKGTEAARTTIAGSPMQSLAWDDRQQIEQNAGFPVGDTSLATSPGYRDLVGQPPPSDLRTIHQREKIVKDVYTRLIQPDITAIVLTGIGGVGKSTLAAAIYNYAEKQRLAGNGPFTAEALWFGMDSEITMADLAGTLFESFDKPFLDFRALSPQNQANLLFNALNEVDKPRLLILDEFDKLLDLQTGRVLPDRPGIGEWIDIINSQKCTCRLLLTSRPFPRATLEYVPEYIQEYVVRGMEVVEGIELLRNLGVRGTEEELRTAVALCDGHAFSLTLIASLVRNHSLSLATLFKDPDYVRLWQGDIAKNLLDSIYLQLDQVQRQLLLAFSIYREGAPLEAVQAIANFNDEISTSQLLSELESLLTQHFLRPTGQGRYQLHDIVANYAQSHFDESDERANQQALQTAHAKAAQYYLQQSAINTPMRERRRGIKDVQLLIEAVWHLCQAGQWREAYDLMEREELSENLFRWGGASILLELYQLLLPQEKWEPEQSQLARIYSNTGRIYYSLEQLKLAREYYEKALIIYREVQDYYGEGITLNNLGKVYFDLGQSKHALAFYEQALEISRRIEDRRGQGVALNNLGEIYSLLRELDRARQYYMHALSISKEIGDRYGEGVSLNNLGQIYQALGQREEARQFFERALSISRQVGDRSEEGVALLNMGSLYFEQRRYDTALACFLMARSIFEYLQSPHRDKAEKWIDNLSREVGEQRFAALIQGAELQSAQIVEQALREALPMPTSGETRNDK